MISIYSITSLQTPKIYIGSTKTSLRCRLYQHKKDLKRFQDNQRSNMSSFGVVCYADAIITLIDTCDETIRYEREKHAQDNTINCCNIRDPTVYKTTRPIQNKTPDSFTPEQVEKFNKCPTKNSEYVLRNYYRYKNEKLRYHALRRTRMLGIVPKASTIEKYGIETEDLDKALLAFENK